MSNAVEEKVKDSDIAEENLFEPSRISIDLTPQNIKFIRSPGGLISIDFTNHKGEREFLERVVIFRSFPITNPKSLSIFRATLSLT